MKKIILATIILLAITGTASAICIPPFMTPCRSDDGTCQASQQFAISMYQQCLMSQQAAMQQPVYQQPQVIIVAPPAPLRPAIMYPHRVR